jgi:PAS domain-containing protein
VHAPVRSPDEIGSGAGPQRHGRRLRDKIRDLEQEQAKATAILDGMVEGVLAVDGHNLIVLMNERARAMFALGPSPVAGRPFLEVIRNVDLHEVLRQTRIGDGVTRSYAVHPLARGGQRRVPGPGPRGGRGDGPHDVTDAAAEQVRRSSSPTFPTRCVRR